MTNDSFENRASSIEYRASSIEHRVSSDGARATSDEDMQNKPNFPDAQMNVSAVITMNYEQLTMNNEPKKQTQSNPIYRGVAYGEAGIYRGVASGEAGIYRGVAFGEAGTNPIDTPVANMDNPVEVAGGSLVQPVPNMFSNYAQAGQKQPSSNVNPAVYLGSCLKVQNKYEC
jgi:hypothetical protein